MNRVLQRELLDDLPAADPRAIHSRRDLRRLNALMGNARHILRFLDANFARLPIHIIELGAGDGNISQKISLHFKGSRVTAIDQQPCAPGIISADVFEWLPTAPSADVIVANLFLHHFLEHQIRQLFEQCAQRCQIFVACEPRRNAIAGWFARRVNLVGCNDVTVHDAGISVRAGFNGRELSNLWPGAAVWRLTERRAGLFTHFFGASRT